ncbi:MAG: DUF4062 domain-containing protein [Spirochaetia bacterium]|nr:DUF4062 domain-containing protein [Spirochaetia bacterium]
MAKPRIFISSTFYDLSDARMALREHFISLGFEPLNFESNDFGVTPGKHAQHAALDQIDNADYFLLIIGGKIGSNYVDSKKSITNQEYISAIKKKLPVFIFVKEAVYNALTIYKKNPGANFKPIVDDIRIFQFIETINAQTEDNWIRKFDTVIDIKNAITHQIAYIALLFSKRLIEERTPNKLKATRVTTKVLPANFNKINDEYEDIDGANSVISGLKDLHSLIKKIQESPISKKEEKFHTLFIIGLKGELETQSISLNNDIFKQYAWAETRGQRIANQFRDFGIIIEYEDDEDHNGQWNRQINLSYEIGDSYEFVYALRYYVNKLYELMSEDIELAENIFKTGDMSLFTE